MEDKIKLKRTMNVSRAVAMMVSTMVGSGIFISPKGVLIYTGSFGMNLVVWILCGFISMGAGLCYAELGTLVRESGGSWAYIRTAFGPIPAFMSAWINLVIVPVGAALQMQAGAEYLLIIAFGSCQTPRSIVKMGGVVLVWMAFYINTSVKMSYRVMKVLFFVKILALVLIIVGGVYWMITHGTSKLQGAFEGTTQNGWSIAAAFYSGLWPFSGWAVVNNLVEEVKNVKRTLPASIIISLSTMTVLYVLVNISYYSVLTTQEVLASSAVAMDWGAIVVGDWARMFSVIVCLSMFGTVVSAAFSRTRVILALAREGQAPQALSMVSVDDNAPISIIMFCLIIGTISSITGDIFSLLEFIGFASWFIHGIAFLSLIKLRLTGYQGPSNSAVFRVPLPLPIIMVAICLYLIVVPVVAAPRLHYLYAVICILSGLPFYFIFTRAKIQGRWVDKVTVLYQLLFRLGIPDKQLL